MKTRNKFDLYLMATINTETSKLRQLSHSSLGLIELEELAKKHGTKNLEQAINLEAKKRALNILTGK